MTRNTHVTATQFATAATALGLNPGVAYALPYGGWSQATPYDRILSECEEAVEDSEYLDMEDALADALGLAVLVAEDSQGRIVGAWSYAGWVLGNRSLGTIDKAQERVHAG